MQKTSRTWLRDKRLEEGEEPTAGRQGCEQGKGELTKRGVGGGDADPGRADPRAPAEPQQPETRCIPRPTLPRTCSTFPPTAGAPPMGPHSIPVHTSSSGC